MSLPLFALASLALLVVGYRWYGRRVARAFGLDDDRPTPAHSKEDGVDYVPTPPFYLFAQHFSAIAAAGPIAGPILACQMFGYLPCLLWIGLGVVFIGAVHDFSSLIASVRHGAGSIAEIARERLGTGAGRAMMAFIWIALIYVIVAFTDITAASFVRGSEELEAASVRFHPGGAVAAASVSYLLLSIVMGLVQRFLKPPLWLLTLVFVPATFGVAWLGTTISELLNLSLATWAALILAYCALASVLPVWLLLQPRGYLGGFVLYTALALGVIGMLFGGYTIEQPAFRGFNATPSGTPLFPFLFVTIACGACSGFHGLVCSGTTSKQVACESDTRFVGYGAMLAEAFVAVIALVTVLIVPSEKLAGLKPGTIYGNGIGDFLTILIGPERRAFAITFGAMAFSTFVFDTLDVATRLGRYIVQELLGWKGWPGAIVGTLATVLPPWFFLSYAEEGAYLRFWTLFGASNQLLAALTLIAVAAWLHQEGKQTTFVVLPLCFLTTITLWALGQIAWTNLRAPSPTAVSIGNAVAAILLLLLALYLLAAGVRHLRAPRPRT